VTSRLRELIQQLGEAIHESVIESEQIAGVVQDIRKHGFDVLLMLEATIGLNEVAAKEAEAAAAGSGSVDKDAPAGEFTPTTCTSCAPCGFPSKAKKKALRRTTPSSRNSTWSFCFAAALLENQLFSATRMCNSFSWCSLTEVGASAIRSIAFAVLGNAITSRRLGAPASNITMRSRPRAIPPCGGVPYSSASRKKPKRALRFLV